MNRLQELTAGYRERVTGVTPTGPGPYVARPMISLLRDHQCSCAEYVDGDLEWRGSMTAGSGFVWSAMMGGRE